MAGFGAKIQLTVDRSGVAKTTFRNEVNELIKDAKINKINISKSFTITQEEINRVIKDTSDAMQKSPITLHIKKIDCSDAINNVRKQLKDMFSALSLQNGVNITGLKEFVDTDGMKEVSAEIQGALTTLNNISAKVNSQFGTAVSKGSEYKDINTELTTLLPKLNEYNAKVAQARTIGSTTTPEDIANIQAEGVALANDIAQIQQKIVAIQQEEAASKRASKSKQEDHQNEIASQKQIFSLYKQVTSFKNNNTRIQGTDLASSIELMLRKLEAGGKMTKTELKGLQQEFVEIQAKALQTGYTGKSALDRIGAAYKKFGGWSIITRSLTAAYRVIKQMVTNVIELDTAMTELKKVTNETDATYKKFLDNAVDRAKELGSTLTDTVSATAD